MNSSERLYGPEAQAVISGYLKQADSRKNQRVWEETIYKIKKEFGLYFWELELLLRENELTMHILAVPKEIALRDKEDMYAANPNDHSVPCNFVAVCYPQGLTSLLEAAQNLDLSYDPVVNQVDLHDSGVLVVRPGTETARQMMASNN